MADNAPTNPLLEALRLSRDYIFQRHYRKDEGEDFKLAKVICELLNARIAELLPEDPVDSITAADVLGEILLHAKAGKVATARRRILVQSKQEREEARLAAEQAVTSWRAEEIASRKNRELLADLAAKMNMPKEEAPQ